MTWRIFSLFFEGREQSAFEIFDLCQEQLQRFLCTRVERHDAEDLLSQIRLSFHERLPRLRDHGQARSFLYQVARDELKKHWLERKRQLSLESASEPQLEGTPETRLLSDERLTMLRQCIEALPDTTIQQVAKLRYRQGSRHAHIQNHLGLTVDQVKKYLKKAEIGITDCVRGKMVIS